MTDTEATAPKPEKTPEQKANGHAVRVMARAMSKLEEGTPEELKARWNENKTKYTSDARKLVRALGKDGISLQLDETKTRKAMRGTGAGAGAGAGGKKDKADNAE